jgi:hypothetical protein
MDRNNYIEIHPTQAAKISYHQSSKYFTSTSILALGNISGFINARKILTVYIILKEFREISLAHMLV